MKVENKEKVSETDSIFDWKLKAIECGTKNT